MKQIFGAIAVLALCLLFCWGGYWLGINQHSLTTPPGPTPEIKPTNPKVAPHFDATAFAEISARSLTTRIPVLMYHDVIKRRGKGSVWFDCSIVELREQIAFFKAEGIQPISLKQLHEHLTTGAPVPEKAIVLTFDDNYQGFYDNAYPLLKAEKYPCALFVHTNFVGDKSGDHPKLDWDTDLLLDKEGLVTIGSHTLSHPDDLATLPTAEQEKELKDSKALLEQKLGHPIPYIAYPNGKNGELTRQLAREIGYTMAFTIVNGQAEESPGILSLNRYIHTRYKKAWEERTSSIAGAPATTSLPLKASHVRLEVKEFAGVKMGIIRGGTPGSHRVNSRQGVGFFVQAAKGVAGINGTFFADARISSTSSALIGPNQSGEDKLFSPEPDPYLIGRIHNRPVVLWSKNEIKIAPFQPWLNTSAAFEELLPNYSDLFMAGAWIVHDSKARTFEEMETYSTPDFKDPRRRAFFGITAEGEIIAGGTLDVVTTMRMAEAAVAAGAKEAVLLDSGFSTSVVYNGKIIVTGHTARDVTSRPVPHAIVFTGELSPNLDPETKAFFDQSGSSLTVAHDESYYRTSTHRRHRRHRRE